MRDVGGEGGLQVSELDELKEAIENLTGDDLAQLLDALVDKHEKRFEELTQPEPKYKIGQTVYRLSGKLEPKAFEDSGCADDDLLEPAIEKLESVINSKQELIAEDIEAKHYEYELCRKANQELKMRIKEKEAELFELKEKEAELFELKERMRGYPDDCQKVQIQF